MEPRPHNPVLTQNNSICIELSDPLSLQAVNSLFLDRKKYLYSSSENDKQPVAKNFKWW